MSDPTTLRELVTKWREQAVQLRAQWLAPPSSFMAKAEADRLDTCANDLLASLGDAVAPQPQFTADELALIASVFTDLATEGRESEDPDMVAEAPYLKALARKAGRLVPVGHQPTFPAPPEDGPA